MHDFHSVARRQLLGGVLLATDDAEIDFDGDAFAFKPEFADEIRNRTALGDGAGFAIENDVHRAKLVARRQLYNQHPVW